MLRYFDMMYYHMATFYQRFYKKTSGWQMQAIFVVSITQLVLLVDLWMTINSILQIKEKTTVFEKITVFSIVLFLAFYNKKKYEKKYQYYKSIWGVYEGNKKRFQIFLSFFTVVFAWCFVFILGWIFNKY